MPSCGSVAGDAGAIPGVPKTDLTQPPLVPPLEFPMRNLIVALMLTAFAASPAYANKQQNKMKQCNVEAKEKDLKGPERKAFMKTCLSAAKEEAKAARNAQQQKMKDCNKEAKEKALKGAERKAFMKTCLSK